MTVSCHLALLNRLPADFVASLEAGTEDLPPAFFSLRRLRPVTMRPEPEQKGALLKLARSQIREMEGRPSELIPDQRWMPTDELLQLTGTPMIPSSSPCLDESGIS